MKSKLILLFFFSLFFIALISYSIHSTYETFQKKSAKRIIVIDVGHGGFDPGKVSNTGIKEKDINLQIAKYLYEYLRSEDYIVYMTRSTDCSLADENSSHKKTSDLTNRLLFTNEKQADYLISIHQNSYPDSSVHGAQTFYNVKNEENKNLASYIQASLLKVDSTNKRQVKSNSSYYILKNSSIPSVLIECGFLSNPEEASNLSDSYYQKQLAYSICSGIIQYDSNLKIE